MFEASTVIVFSVQLLECGSIYVVQSAFVASFDKYGTGFDDNVLALYEGDIQLNCGQIKSTTLG